MVRKLPGVFYSLAVWKICSMAMLLDHDLAPRRFTAWLTAGPRW